MSSSLIFELIAFLFTLIGVYLSARNQATGWIFGIIGSVLYVPVFFGEMLYAEAALQIFYVCVGFYGMWNWLRIEKAYTRYSILKIRKKEVCILLVLMVLGSFLLGFILKSCSNTDVPYFDASMGISGLLITWMMAKKLIENWVCWVVVDVVNAGLFIYKSLYLTAILYFFMAIVALYGLKTWRREFATS